jgi:hypothetical protein
MRFIYAKNILCLLILFCGIKSQAQTDTSQKKLPFAIAKEKRLPDDELAEKKEGVYVTGIPDLSSDPINGFGAGAEGSIFFNGKKSDPFFDIGGVWNDLSRLNHFENWRYSEVLGMRIAWNINTILRFDYAFSKEDHQFFFSLGHAF